MYWAFQTPPTNSSPVVMFGVRVGGMSLFSVVILTRRLAPKVQLVHDAWARPARRTHAGGIEVENEGRSP